MALMDRIKGLFNSPQTVIDETPMREAAGVTIDSDEDDWKPLSTNGKRDLSPVTQRRMQELAVFLWEGNLLANRLIELPVAYLLAEGVQLVVGDDEAKGWLKAFWRDPINKMDIRLPQISRELALFGEQCWPAFVNEMNGHVRIGSLDPALIETVVMDPDNSAQPIGIVTRRDKRGNSRRYRVIVNGDENVFSTRTQEIRTTFTDGNCFYFAINALTAGRRGRSDLLAATDWLDAYDQFLYGEMQRGNFMRAFIWDVTLKGATPEEVKQRSREISPPAPGSTRVHNDQEEWDAVSPDLKAQDSDTFARMFRNHVMGGGTMPEHWFGGGGDVNRATAGEMGEPTFKMFSMRQALVKYMLEMVGTFVVHQRTLALYGTLPGDAEAADYEVSAEFPEMTARDTSSYAAALQQVAIACGVAIDRGLLSEATAVAIIAAIGARLGVTIDPAAELESARADASRRTEDDVFTVPPEPDQNQET